MALNTDKTADARLADTVITGVNNYDVVAISSNVDCLGEKIDIKQGGNVHDTSSPDLMESTASSVPLSSLSVAGDDDGFSATPVAGSRWTNEEDDRLIEVGIICDCGGSRGVFYAFFWRPPRYLFFWYSYLCVWWLF